MPDEKSDFAAGISNETLCQYFFVVFIIIAAFSGIAVLSTVYMFWKRPTFLLSSLLQLTPSIAIAITNSLFLYILCSRSLLK
jgi:hypothetical protein